MPQSTTNIIWNNCFMHQAIFSYLVHHIPLKWTWLSSCSGFGKEWSMRLLEHRNSLRTTQKQFSQNRFTHSRHQAFLTLLVTFSVRCMTVRSIEKTFQEHGHTWQAQNRWHEAKQLSYSKHHFSFCLHSSFPFSPLLGNTNGIFGNDTQKRGKEVSHSVGLVWELFCNKWEFVLHMSSWKAWWVDGYGTCENVFWEERGG